MELNEIINKAVKIAVNPVNHVLSPTLHSLMNLNVTQDGSVSIKHGLILVPIDVFMFSTFRSYKRRVIINQSDFTIKQILN